MRRKRMDKALWDSQSETTNGDRIAAGAKVLDWRRKMSDHVAYGLLVYTGLQIVVTMGALKSIGTSLLPYFGLVVLVAAIIPACRFCERRWEGLDDEEAANPELADAFKRDRNFLWAGAIVLPFLLTGLFRAIAYFI
jgi:hypothetical protein